jgi:hypothetical protein
MVNIQHRTLKQKPYNHTIKENLPVYKTNPSDSPKWLDPYFGEAYISTAGEVGILNPYKRARTLPNPSAKILAPRTNSRTNLRAIPCTNQIANPMTNLLANPPTNPLANLLAYLLANPPTNLMTRSPKLPKGTT